LTTINDPSGPASERLDVVDGWTIIADGGGPAGGGHTGAGAGLPGGGPQDPIATALAGAGQDGGLTRLCYAGRPCVLRLACERGEAGLVMTVAAELRDGSDVALASTSIRLLTPVRSLARMDPWGAIRVRRGLRTVLSRAAASIDSAVS
jgi:hypothetical protein